jgi:hypothetical protein
VLREDPLPVHDDVEDAVVTADERGGHAGRLLDLGRQTGGPGQVVSTTAVGDLDLHAGSSLENGGSADPEELRIALRASSVRIAAKYTRRRPIRRRRASRRPPGPAAVRIRPASSAMGRIETR